MISFDSNKLDYVNKKAIEIFNSIIEIKREVKQLDKSLSRSLNHKDFTILDSSKILNTKQYETDNYTKKKLSVNFNSEEKTFGLDKERYKGLINLIIQIQKDYSVKQYLSYEFIENVITDWLFYKYENEKTEDFVSFFLQESNSSIKDYNVMFPVSALEINGAFQIGKCSILFFSSEYISILTQEYLADNPTANGDKYYESISKYKGRVFIITTIKAEKKRAIELGFDECLLSISALKICSITTINPIYRMEIDISRTKRYGEMASEVLLQTGSKAYEFIFHVFNDHKYYELNEETFTLAKMLKLEDFHKFLISRKEKNSELIDIITNTIKAYSEAISNNNLHQRIVQIYTILESLLLKSDNVPIIDSVSKYCSKLIHKEPADRTKAISLLKGMYDIRSAYIHHGKNKVFEEDDLKTLQLIVIELLISLIRLTSKHETKISVLDEIDDAILKAY